MNRTIGFVLTAIGISVIGLALVLGRSGGSAQTVTAFPSGSEQPDPGGVFVNGYNLPQTAPCDFADVYAGAHDLTGVPIGSFTGRSQDFAFVRLVCSPLDPSKPVDYDNLGLEYLRTSGMSPEPDSAPHPLVRAYLQDAAATGLDPSFYGRIISKPICKGDLCQQYTDRTLLLIDQKAGTVRWAPLGCWLNQACAKAQSAPPPDHSLSAIAVAALLLGAALSLSGLASLLTQRRSGLAHGMGIA